MTTKKKKMPRMVCLNFKSFLLFSYCGKFNALNCTFIYADFIVDDHGADLPDEASGRRMHRPLLSREDDQEDVEALERSIQARYAKSMHSEYDEETTEVEQQALLPSVRDPKLWMVKCAVCLSLVLGRGFHIYVYYMYSCAY